jgi:Zn-dependent protease with chaperone function
LIIPWLVFSALLDSVSLIPGGTFDYVRSNLLVSGLLLAGFIVCIGIFFPWIIVRVWGCSPLPDGPVRRDIQKVCAQAGVRCSGIYEWNLFGGTLLSAGVMGFVPAFRYLLISPALLHLLDRSELEAVIAHEAGHVQHKHMLFYLVFILGYGFISAVFYRYFFSAVLTSDLFLALALREDGTLGIVYHCVMIGSAITLLLLYFRLLFGVISRAFERQADCAALRLTGSANGIIGALEKISTEGTHSRSAPSWHHNSIDTRIAYLRSCERMPQQSARHSRRVFTLTGGYCVVLAVLALLVWNNRVSLSEYDAGNSLKFVEKLTQRQPDNAGLRFHLAGLYYEKNLFSAAEKEYRMAIELQPEFYDAYNNLAWMYATCEDPAVRNYPESLRLARIAVSLAPYAYILDTLAESLYVNGLYYQAIIASEEALNAARPENRSYYAGQLEKFRDAYGARDIPVEYQESSRIAL